MEKGVRDMECTFSSGNHLNVKEKYTKLLFCPLLFEDGETKAICLHHCLRLQSIFERITELLRQDITRKQLINDPECFHQYLAGEVLDMVKEIKLNRNWNEARNSCLNCHPIEVEPNPDIVPVGSSIEATNAAVLRKAADVGDTEIHQVGRDKLEV